MSSSSWLRFHQHIQSTHATRLVYAAAALAAITLTAHSASAAPITVYGGPTYTPGVGGFGVVVGVTDAGTAVGNANAAYRWDTSGTTAIWFGTYATDINNAGTAVGFLGDFLTLGVAFRWDGSDWSFLESLGARGEPYTDQTFASGINYAGTAVGWSTMYNESGAYQGIRPVRWDGSGTAATELQNVGGGSGVVPSAINNGGTAVGSPNILDIGVYPCDAVRWDGSGTAATVLGNLGMDHSPFTFSNAVAINDAGTAVGNSYKYGPGVFLGQRAVRWDASGTAATELDNLGTDTSHVTQSGAVAINDAGTIVGYANMYDNSGESLGRRAVRWDASGTAATELGNLGAIGGITETDAFAINDAGIAVGYADDYDGSGANLGERAVYWGLDAVAVDLNTLIDPVSGWTLNRATAISNTGWVGGSGLFDPDGAGGQESYARLYLMQIAAPNFLPGDYNQNGSVDAADYVVLRKNFSNDQTKYNEWRANYGRTFFASSGATLPSVDSLSAAVPEPATVVLFGVGLVGLGAASRRRVRRSIATTKN